MTMLPIYQLFDSNQLESLLALTYEFDDGQLKFIFGGNSPDVVENMYSKTPVVIYEGSKTKEFAKIPPFIELHPIPPAGGIHHSKAYLLVRQKAIFLILGSFNLTTSGFNRNRESFVKLEWSVKTLQNISVIEGFIKLLTTYYLNENADGFKHLREIINSVQNKINRWKKRYKGKKEEDDHFFLFSGYTATKNDNGLNKLKALWNKHFSEKPAARMLVVSPFFDQNAEKKTLFEEFVKVGLADKHTNVQLVSARNDKGKCPFSEKFFKKTGSTFPKFCAYLCNVRVNGESKEGQAICKANDHQQIGRSTQNEVFDRPLHAKILILSNTKGQESLVYAGSANFTKNAWIGRNKELGLVLIDRKNHFDTITGHILKMLSAEKKDLTPYFSVETPLADDEIEVDTYYPSFVDCILLKRSEDNHVYFEMKVRTDTSTSNLKGYLTQWGDRTIEWKKNGEDAYQSADIPVDYAVRFLLTARNIKFTWRKDETVYYFLPYLYADTIVENRFKYICPDSDSWIQYYLSGQNIFRGKAENIELPGGEDEEDGFHELGISAEREKNLTVSMQRFISSLPEIERLWQNDIDLALKYVDDDISFKDIWSEDKLSNVAVLYCIIKDELKSGKELYAAPFFKACELLMMTGRIKNLYCSRPKFKPALKEFEDLIQKEIGELTTFLEATFLKKKRLAEKTPFREYFNGIVRKGLS